MATPESKVKAQVKALLKEHGAYMFMPATHGYGSSGVPDIVACWQGAFIGIECKAKGGRVTALQMRNLNEIEAQKGIALLVDETGIGVLKLELGSWAITGMIPREGYISELTSRAKPTD